MNELLVDKKVAILATDGFEQSELEEPLDALQNAGATVSVVSLKSGTILGMEHTEKGQPIEVSLTLVGPEKPRRPFI